MKNLKRDCIRVSQGRQLVLNGLKSWKGIEKLKLRKKDSKWHRGWRRSKNLSGKSRLSMTDGVEKLTWMLKSPTKKSRSLWR